MDPDIETLLAIESLRAPMNPLPQSNQERFLHELRLKYRCFIVEYNGTQGAVKMPSLFSDDFYHQISRVATLVDAQDNEFQCLVEKINGNVYLTRGWSALRDFYGIRLGAWLMMLYTGGGQFGLIVQDRFHQMMDAPSLVPPAKFIIDMENVPLDFSNGLPENTQILSYFHPTSAFNLCFEKELTDYDVRSGFLLVPYEEFGHDAFDQDTTSLKLVDECGNVWMCDLIYVSFPFKHYKLGGGWVSFVAAKRLDSKDIIRLGAQERGHNQTIYFKLNP